MKTHLIMNDFQFCTLLDPANGCSSNTNYFSSHNSISKKYYDGNGLMRKETIDNYFGYNVKMNLPIAGATAVKDIITATN